MGSQGQDLVCECVCSLAVWVLSMKRTLTALTVAATMFANSASALDPADLQKLKDTGDCSMRDLSAAPFADLVSMYLV